MYRFAAHGHRTFVLFWGAKGPGRGGAAGGIAIER
jgi:hypothetical protein